MSSAHTSTAVRVPSTHVTHSCTEVLPIVIILNEKTKEHTRVKTRHRHFPDSVAMKCLQLLRGVSVVQPGDVVLSASNLR